MHLLKGEVKHTSRALIGSANPLSPVDCAMVSETRVPGFPSPRPRERDGQTPRVSGQFSNGTNGGTCGLKLAADSEVKRQKEMWPYLTPVSQRPAGARLPSALATDSCRHTSVLLKNNRSKATRFELPPSKCGDIDIGNYVSSLDMPKAGNVQQAAKRNQSFEKASPTSRDTTGLST